MAIELLTSAYPQFDFPQQTDEIRAITQQMRAFQGHIVGKMNEIITEINRLTVAVEDLETS